MRMLACCLWDGRVLFLVIAACDWIVCDFEVAMLLMSEKICLLFDLKS